MFKWLSRLWKTGDPQAALRGRPGGAPRQTNRPRLELESLEDRVVPSLAGWQPLAPSAMIQIATETDQAGHVQVFAVGQNHAVYVNTGNADVYNTSSWTGWQPLGGWVSSIAVGKDLWGRTEVFGIGANSGLWVAAQSGVNLSSWSNWQPLGGGLLQQIVATNNAYGQLDVFAIGGKNAVYQDWQGVNGGWSGLQPLGGWVSSLAAARDVQGRIEVFGIGQNTGLWVSTQSGPNTTTFGAWQPQGGSALHQIAVGTNGNGLLEVFAIGGDQQVYDQWQTSANSWSGWASKPLAAGQGLTFTALAVGLSYYGDLEVAGISAQNGQVYTIFQTQPNNASAWQSRWVSLGGEQAQQLALSNPNGSLDLFELNTNGSVYYQPGAPIF